MTKIAGWRLHGESSCNDLIAGLLPANGMHFLVCADDDTRKAVVADLAVSIAAGPMARDLLKTDDGYRIVGGFHGLEVGEAKGVAIIGAATWNDVKAAAVWRGQDDLPIAVSTSHLNDVVSVRLHDFADAIKPTPLGLVVVSANWSRGVEEVRRILNFGNVSWATIVVSTTEPPANLVRGETRVLRVADGSLTLEYPKTIAPWAAPFALEPIHMASGKAHAVRPSAEAVSAPQLAPVAPEAPEAALEPYAGHVICWRSVFGLHPSEPARWPEGARFEEQPFEAARAASEIEGRVQIILALGPESKLDPKEERRRINTALAQFKIAQRVDVTIAAQKLLDARDVRDRIVPAA